ncbi:DNA polymerase III subunit delta' [Sphingosinithalassobacter sp. LHW66-3]|uniref:DNA polymerase III subunit delta' n=1 Tax=Sphingosinithalassobacter sp. LHW66-3 TaxID=3424718 RepID=UPI003D6B57D3
MPDRSAAEPGFVGNEAARAAFADAVNGQALHHGWLIAGPEGLGKASFARFAALRLLASASGPEPFDMPWHRLMADKTTRMFAAAAHPDYLELARLPGSVAPDKTSYSALNRIVAPDRMRFLRATFPEFSPPDEIEAKDEAVRRGISVHQARALIHATGAKPALSSRRVVVVDSADDLERSAANALLKILEEPPAGTIFLLVSHSPGRLLPTIRSRCRLLRFEPLSDAQITAILRAELPDASAAEIDALKRAGEGSPGRALRFAGLDLAALETELAALAESGDPSNVVRARLAKLLGTKAAQARYEAFLDRAPSFIAERARSLRGTALREALDAYEAAVALAGSAVGLSLDSGATVFEMSGLVARLAPRN